MTARAPSARARVLARHLDELRRALERARGAARLDGKMRIRVGGATLEIDAPSAGRVDAFFAAGDRAERCETLFAHGLALLARSSEDCAALERQERGGGRVHRYALQAELMLDAAVGLALVREIGPESERLAAAGRAEDARRLAELGNLVSSIEARVQGHVARSDRARAEELVATMLDDPSNLDLPAAREPLRRDVHARALSAARLPVAAATAAPEVEVEPDERPAWGSPARSSGRRTVWLAGALAVTTLLRIAAPGRGEPVRAVPPPPGGVPGLIEVADRYPAAYAEVSDDAWEGLGEDERFAALGRLGDWAGRGGFRGLFVRTDAGRPVGSWTDGGPVRLLQPTAEK